MSTDKEITTLQFDTRWTSTEMNTAVPTDSFLLENVSLTTSQVDLNSTVTELLQNTSGTIPGAQTEDWYMSEATFIVSALILIAEFIGGLLTNVVLILTIYHSPSLKTPPNAHLVNISMTNLCLCLSILLSICSLFLPNTEIPSGALRFLGIGQTLLWVTCMAQYWSIFASIGFYRSRTVKKPAMTQEERKRIIARCIWLSWILSISLGILIVAAFYAGDHAVSWNPFIRVIKDVNSTKIKPLSSDQAAVMYIVVLLLLVGLVVVCRSYSTIFRALFKTKPVGRNKVSPWQRAASMSSDGTDFELNNPGRNYEPDENTPSVSAFKISNGAMMEKFTVHYHKRHQSLTFDEVLALERIEKPKRQPVQPGGGHRFLQAQDSTASNNSMHSSYLEFSDISPGAELQRFQQIKNNFAIKSHSVRRDRISLRAATKNTLVMLFTYLVCSIPLFLCSIPGMLNHLSPGQISLTLLICRLVFYMNSPTYPVWYLMFSKRVRQSLCRLSENILVKLHLRG